MGEYFHYNTRQVRDNAKFKHFMKDILGSFDNDFNKLLKDLESVQQQATPIAAK